MIICVDVRRLGRSKHWDTSTRKWIRTPVRKGFKRCYGGCRFIKCDTDVWNRLNAMCGRRKFNENNDNEEFNELLLKVFS